MFPPVDKKSFPDRELEVLEFWRAQDTYHQSLKAREGAPSFVFYEGPPTANGMPHPGHCLTRAIKDLFPRYKTMRGYRCERKAGWDTHGLPVETEVSKELGIHSKEEIEAYGIEPFIQLCQKSVWRYMQEWERLTERIGFWVDLKEAYVTYHQRYVESVWWSLKVLFDRGLLYKGHKIVWWWAQGGTALSAGEVGQGYRQVADPSVYVKFPLLDDSGNLTDTSLLLWTTTPWTLPSNQYAAVNTSISYVTLIDPDDGSKVIIAARAKETLEAKTRKQFAECGDLMSGSQLVDRRYVPPYDFYWRPLQGKTGELVESSATRSYAFKYFLSAGSFTTSKDENLSVGRQRYAEWLRHQPARRQGWVVVPGNFVTTDTGTGIVHIAPAFGEDDYGILAEQQSLVADVNKPGLINAVSPSGKFTDEGPDYCRGRWVKECDKDIVRDLDERGLLFNKRGDQYVHDYPFCWRAEEDPLIQYPRESWFIRTTAYKDSMLENNSHINWLPEHIKDGRFGNFLESNVDWALSRERYWGTPLPIWVCSETGKMEAISSYDELLAKPGVAGTDVWDAAKRARPELVDDLRVHKPYIDAVTYDSPFAKGARMERVSEVIDCWYDSGAMPFAQWGYQGELANQQDSSGSLPLAGRAGEGVEAGTRQPPDRQSGTLKSGGKSAVGQSPLPNPPHRGEGTGGELEMAAERFHSQFPADFISEAIDQTRGWFYSQLAISTMLFGEGRGARGEERDSETRPSPLYPHPFRNCIVLGLMLGEDGQKMSKSKRNYREPGEIFDRYGADALRWYFFANQPPWTSIRYSEQAIKDSVPEFLLRLWNVYSFFTIYANIDGFDPSQEVRGQRSGVRGGTWDASLSAGLLAGSETYRPLPHRSELDRWILSELNRTAAAVVARMDEYDNFAACAAITEFVDALSNWYVRRSRDRFWAADKRCVDKLDAYWTLYECLVTSAKLIAPFTPFLAESLWQNLAVAPFRDAGVGDVAASVHLCDYPTGDAAAIDEQLSARMNLVRHISSLGRQARTTSNLKVRQPLARVEVILADPTHEAWLREHADVIADELNVKQVEFTDQPDKYVTHEVLPNFKRLGPKLGKLLPKLEQVLAQQSGAELLANLRDDGELNLTIDGQAVAITLDEVEVRIQAKPGWAAANDKGVVVVLATELTPELIAEGLARDLVRVIQDRRKEIACEFTDRVAVEVQTDSAELVGAVDAFREYIAGETLADSVGAKLLADSPASETKVGDAAVVLKLKIVR